MTARKWFRVLASGAIVLVTAGAVVFVGMNAAEGEPRYPKEVPTPDPEVQRSTENDALQSILAQGRLVKRETAVGDGPVELRPDGATPVATPAVADLAGLSLPLPPGIMFNEALPFGPSQGPKTRNWVFSYEDGTGLSRLSVDAQGVILLSDILPSHSHLFEPILHALEDPGK
jgi:hypothetical protein